MRRKSIVLSVLLMLFSHSAFAPLAAQEEAFKRTANSSELISLLYKPDAVLTLDVRRMLTDTAPDLLNNEPTSIEKLKKVMQLIEDQTGVDPYAVNQIVVGISISKNKPENIIIALQTESSGANKLADKIFQNQSANAKFLMEKYPLRKRIAILSSNLSSNEFSTAETGAETIRTKLKDFSTKINEIKSSLAGIKPSKANEAALNSLNKTAAHIAAALSTFSELIETPVDLTDVKVQNDNLNNSLTAVALSDADRSSKIISISKQLDQIEKDSSAKIKRARLFASFMESESNEPLAENALTSVQNSLSQLPATETDAKSALRQKNTS